MRVRGMAFVGARAESYRLGFFWFPLGPLVRLLGCQLGTWAVSVGMGGRCVCVCVCVWIPMGYGLGLEIIAGVDCGVMITATS